MFESISRHGPQVMGAFGPWMLRVFCVHGALEVLCEFMELMYLVFCIVRLWPQIHNCRSLTFCLMSYVIGVSL